MCSNCLLDLGMDFLVGIMVCDMIVYHTGVYDTMVYDIAVFDVVINDETVVMIWPGLEFGKSQRSVENRVKWRKLVAKSSVVPQRPSRLRDR